MKTLLSLCVVVASVGACSAGGGGTGLSDGGATSSTASDGGASTPPGTSPSPSGTPTTGDCHVQVIAPALSGGCAPRLVTPAACEVVDLSGGKTYEVAWTTDGTGCETPWKLCVAGSPVTDPNSACVSLSENVSAGISKTGGILNISASDLAGLTSDNGLYHGLVASFYGSHAGSVAFTVKK